MKKLYKNLLFILIFQTNWFLYSEKPTTIFCHGILDTQKQIDRYKDFIQQPKITFDFPDAQQPCGWNFNNFIYQIYKMIRSKPLNRKKMYMGYGPDVETLKNQMSSDESYVLFGFSRGGIAILNYLAENNTDNIQAIILNAVPADLMQSVEGIQKAIGYTIASTRYRQEKLFNMIFPAYQIGSIPPKDIIPSINNKNLPIFIVHAKTDTVVSITSSWQLYIAFLQAGFTNVYLCELEAGQHKAYNKSSDKIKFLHDIHSFYKKYNCACDYKLAIHDNLTNLQPTINEITQKLN